MYLVSVLPLPRLGGRLGSSCATGRARILLASVVVWASAVSSAAAQPYAYVLLQKDQASANAQQALAVIDTQTVTRVTTIPLDVGCCAHNAQSLAASPDGARVFVVNQVSGTVSVVDTTTRTRVGTVTVGGAPRSVTVSPDGLRLYVLLGSTIAVVDTQSLARLGTLQPQMVGTTARGMVISPDGTRLYVHDFGPRRIAVIDATSGTLLGFVPLPDFATNLEITPDGSTIYVTSNGGNVLWVVSTASASVVGTVSDPGGPLRPSTARLTPNLARVYTTNTTTNTLSIIDRATQVVVGTVSNLFFPQSLDFTPDGSRLAVAIFQGVRILDAVTHQVIGTVFIDDILEGNTCTLIVPRPATPPDPPTGLYVASVVGNQVTLRWAPSAGGTPPTSYVVEGGFSPGEVLASLATGSASPIYSFGAPNGAFYVRVRARSLWASSSPSNEVRLFVNTPTPPSPPATLTGLVNGSSLALTWKNTFEGGSPTGAVLDVTGALTLSLPLGPSELFTYIGVPPGTYTFRVRASNAAGVSAPSNPVSLTFPQACTGVPLAPVNVVAYRMDRTGLRAVGSGRHRACYDRLRASRHGLVCRQLRHRRPGNERHGRPRHLRGERVGHERLRRGFRDGRTRSVGAVGAQVRGCPRRAEDGRAHPGPGTYRLTLTLDRQPWPTQDPPDTLNR